ncbi:hypothetical protein M9Y10_032158 [Tritrichomonas musculus]|uniref:Uncharacterized protein n=1 Tax=Tritrichomonas musculus TaxID=1915356 RepID=A0ABR2GZ57_9EUKA
MKVHYYFVYDGSYQFKCIECKYETQISSLIDQIIKTHQQNNEDSSEDGYFLPTDFKAAYLRDQKLDLKEQIGEYFTELENNRIYLSDGSNDGHEYNLRDIRINLNDYIINFEEEFSHDFFYAIEKSTNKKVLIRLYEGSNSAGNSDFYCRIRGFDLSRGLNIPEFIKPVGFGYILTIRNRLDTALHLFMNILKMALLMIKLEFTMNQKGKIKEK